jgi:MFS family permease
MSPIGTKNRKKPEDDVSGTQETGEQAHNRQIHYAWIVLAVGIFVVFGSIGLARFGYSLVLPSMQNALNIDNSGAGGLATLNLIGYLALALIGGALSSRYGPRLVISLGMLVVGTGMFFTGISKGFWSAAIWRFITGTGSGASNVPVMALMSAWFGPNLRGLATGITATGSSIALIVTGPFVPRILAALIDKGWRITWYLFGGFAILLALVSAVLLRDEPGKIGIFALGEKGTEDRQQSLSADKLHWGLVYRSSRVWHLGAVYSAFGFSYIIYMTFFIRYLTGEIGYTQSAAGNLFMLMGWCSLGCGIIWSGLSDRIGRKTALILVFIIHAVSFTLFALWQDNAGLIISAVLFGITAWSIPAIMAAICGDVLGHRLAPAALGFITLFFGIGQAVAPTVAGIIADLTGSFVGAFLLAAAVAVIGCIGAVLLKPVEDMNTTRVL